MGRQISIWKYSWKEKKKPQPKPKKQPPKRASGDTAEQHASGWLADDLGPETHTCLMKLVPKKYRRDFFLHHVAVFC